MRQITHRLKTFFSSSLSSKDCIQLEDKFGCHNYSPLPVVIERAKGV
jgi:hypothetical protein